MREIKFRVWDKDLKKMHVCGENTHDSITFVDNQACYYNLQNGCGSMPNGEGTYEIMQYTGLKDKNGTEIYEGDIYDYDGIGKYVVVYNKGRAGYFPFAKDDGCGCCSIDIVSEPEHGEVIGNIHDNPELVDA